MTIKRQIEKTANTTESTTKNTFSLNEKTGVLTLKLAVEFNKSGTGLKAKHLSKIEGKEYQFVEATDKDGNTIRLYKTGFDYEPKVKATKGISINPKKLEKLDKDELSVLESILAKLA